MSVHFKITFARSSFLSKLWSFSIQHRNNVSWGCIESDHDFERNEDRTTVILKWTDFHNIRKLNLQSHFEGPFFKICANWKIQILRTISDAILQKFCGHFVDNFRNNFRDNFRNNFRNNFRDNFINNFSIMLGKIL